MALRLQRVLIGQLGKWSAARILAVLSTCVLLAVAIECELVWAQAQDSTSHPPVITTNQWSLGAPVVVSADANGVPGNGTSVHASFSPDGTHVLFYSNAKNLVPGGTSGRQQLYIKDLSTGEVKLVSANANGTEASGMCAIPNNSAQVRMFSPDGTKVVFESNSTNLAQGTDGTMEIYVKDLTSGEVTLVSADANGTPGDYGSTDFSFSPDGTKVVFDSTADNLIPGVNRGQQIFMKDLNDHHTVTLVSADGNGEIANGLSAWPVFSPDGHAVAFYSSSSNLVPGIGQQVFVKDLVTQAVTVVSTDSNENVADGQSRFAMFSPDGGKVAFNSMATNFVAGAITVDQVYVKDLASRALTLVSADATGALPNAGSQLPVFSADGAKIAFQSSATNLVQRTSNTQVFVKDLVTGAVTLALSDANGAPVDGSSGDASFSPDHLVMAFESDASSVGAPSNTVQIVLRPIFTPSDAVVDVPLATTLTTAGQLMFADLDANDTHTTAVTAQDGDLGTLTADVTQDSTPTSNGVIRWSYQVNEGQAHALTANAADAFTLVLTDSQGCTATVEMAVTVLPRDFGVANAGGAAVSKTTSSCVTPTTTAVVSSPNPSVYGQPVTFTATVTPIRAVGATPTGTVTFLDGGSAIGTGVLSGGQASFTTAGLNVGSHTITTSYDGDGQFTSSAGSMSGNPQVVNPSDTSAAVVSSQNASVFGQAVTFTATVSAVAPGVGTPTGTVTFWDGGSSLGTVTLSGGMASLTTSDLVVGNHSITSSYGGDGNFNASTSSLSSNPQVVAKANTVTAVYSLANPSVFGQEVTFTVTVSAVAPGAGTPTGTLTFLDGGNTIATATVTGGVASFKTSALAVASHTITTSYDGDGNFNGNAGSLSGNPQIVAKANTSVSVSSSVNPSVWGQGVTFTATVSAVAPGAGMPTGTVTFLDGGSTIGTGTLTGGVASFTTSALVVGNHGVTVDYAGDGNFNGNWGSLGGNPQIVAKANTSVSVSSSVNPSVWGQGVTFTATVSAVAPGAGMPTGTVTLRDGGSAIGTSNLNAGVASFTTSALVVGNHGVTVDYAGDGNFNGSSVSLGGNGQVVAKASTTTTISSSVNPSLVGQAVTFTASISAVTPGAGSPTGTVTFSDGGTVLATVPLSSQGNATTSTSALAVQAHAITAAYSGDGNFNGSSGSLTQSVGYSICVLYDQTRTVHGGATFPIKVALCDSNGNDVSSPAVVLHATAILMLSDVVGTPQAPGNANPDNDFRYSSGLGASGGYIYNLSTGGLGPGTYSLQFTAGADAAPHTVAFGVHP